jgi:hypothetical protein
MFRGAGLSRSPLGMNWGFALNARLRRDCSPACSRNERSHRPIETETVRICWKIQHFRFKTRTLEIRHRCDGSWHCLRSRGLMKPLNAARATVVVALFMERGWFPRAVPPAGGLRAARCPGLQPDTKQNTFDQREVNEREAALGQEQFRSRPSQKLRFLLRQDRTVLYPPLVRSFLLRTNLDPVGAALVIRRWNKTAVRLSRKGQDARQQCTDAGSEEIRR